jgi:hypothetical protein
MTYLLILGGLALAWKWGFRTVLRRALILLALPVLHVHFLRKAENPLAFQAWTLAVLLVLGIFAARRVYHRIRSVRF